MKIADRHCVIGPGRLGKVVMAALVDAGGCVAAVGVRSALDPSAVPPRVRPADAASRADVWWLTVPDDQIPLVVQDLAPAAAEARDQGRQVLAIHCSGLGSLSLLRPLAEAGAATLSLHPLQSFGAHANQDVLRGVPCALTAAAPEAQQAGQDLAIRMGMRPFDLDDERKPLYHLAAALGCNLLVALESEAARLLQEATGRPDGLEMLGPILATTLDNLDRVGPERALTGPVARGDVATVRAHLRLLQHESPRLALAYRALSLQALTLAAPRLDDEMVHALRDLLEIKGTT